MREEGVRVVVVAGVSSQLTEARNALDEVVPRPTTDDAPDGGRTADGPARPNASGMKIYEYVNPSLDRFADLLINRRCAWVADVGRTHTRRRFIATAGLLAAGTAAEAIFRPTNRELVHVPIPRPETPAMKHHRQEAMREKAAEAQHYFDPPLAMPEKYLHDVLGAEEVSKPPAETSFRGLEVLHDSKFFDSSDWQEVPSLEALSRTPVEPAYYTRVLRLRKTEGAPRRVACEFNTGGFCVVPVAIPSRRDKVFYQRKPMPESKRAGGMTLTTYLVIDISELGKEGRPFDLIVNAVWFNGAQDQQLRCAAYDWWGTRLVTGTVKADLAVRLPTTRSFGRVKHMVREEGAPIWEVKEGDRLWAPAGQADGSYTEGAVAVWQIDCTWEEQQNREKTIRFLAAGVSQGKVLPSLGPLAATVRDFRWIYSIQWKWG